MADGFYVGPNDFPNEQPRLLRQQYHLEMEYDEKHNILTKRQAHRQAEVEDLSNPSQWNRVNPTTYTLDYGDYGSGTFSSGDYSYVQPHAPRKIIETPADATGPDDPQIRVQEVDYDADGNMTKVRQKVQNPDNPLEAEVLTLRHHRWDEEDRLRGVDLMPDNDVKMPEIASYTYDASGERTVRYVPGRLDAFYSAHQAGGTDRLESFVYPNGLLTGKTLPEMNTNKQIMTYTKHYYIGSERIASSIGTGNSVGYYLCDSNFSVQDYTAFLNQKMTQAAQGLQDDYDYFEKQLVLNNPFTNRPSCTISHSGGQLNYWFHPDLPIIIGMGSSSYISNDNGEISQHLEYLPFGETLVEEHKNSNNSPYKFNGKELDDETGNYYYGARYLNPKWSFWLSVDPLVEKYPGWSPYNYTMLNPVKFIDPDGRDIEIHYKDNEKNKQIHTYQYGQIYNGDSQYVADVYEALNYIIDNDADVAGIIESLACDPNNIVSVFDNTAENNPLIGDPRTQSYFRTQGHNTGGAEIIWDSRKGLKFKNINGFMGLLTGRGYSEQGFLSPAEGILHEFGHSFNFFSDSKQHEKDSKTFFRSYGDREEFNVIRNVENPASRALERDVIRKSHRGTFYETTSPTSITPIIKK